MLELHLLFFDIITFDNNLIVEQSGTSNTQPYATPTAIRDTHTTSDYKLQKYSNR